MCFEIKTTIILTNGWHLSQYCYLIILILDMHTQLYLKWITNKDSTWNSDQCYVAAWMREEFGGEWIHVYVWLSPFAVHLKLS